MLAVDTSVRCPRKAFTEQIPELPAGAGVTGRLRRHVAGRVADGLAVSVAGDGLVSWPISHAAWVVHADAALAEPEPVTVLGIDETRRGRPSWVQDEGTGRWRLTERFETNFVDLAGSQGLLGRTSGRTTPRPLSWGGSSGAARHGRTACRSSRWTRARPTAPPCTMSACGSLAARVGTQSTGTWDAGVVRSA